MGNLINHLDAHELFWAEVGGATVFLPRGSRLTRLNEASRRLGEETHLDCQSFQLFSLPIFLPCVATSLFLCLFVRHWRDVGRHQLTATVALLTLTGHPTEPLSPPLSPTHFRPASVTCFGGPKTHKGKFISSKLFSTSGTTISSCQPEYRPGFSTTPSSRRLVPFWGLSTVAARSPANEA